MTDLYNLAALESIPPLPELALLDSSPPSLPILSSDMAAHTISARQRTTSSTEPGKPKRARTKHACDECRRSQKKVRRAAAILLYSI